MHSYVGLLFIACLYKLVPSLAVKCSYPSLSHRCKKLSNSEESNWLKVSKWKALLSSLDLRNIDCDEEFSDSSEKRVIQVTSVYDDDVFEFDFDGFLDESKVFEGHGKCCRLLF